jgi:hypothetical protein
MKFKNYLKWFKHWIFKNFCFQESRYFRIGRRLKERKFQTNHMSSENLKCKRLNLNNEHSDNKKYKLRD